MSKGGGDGTEQFNFLTGFQCSSFKMAPRATTFDLNGKAKMVLFFLKNHKNCPAAGGFAAKSSSMIHIICTSLLSTLPNQDIFQAKKLPIGSSLSPPP